MSKQRLEVMVLEILRAVPKVIEVKLSCTSPHLKPHPHLDLKKFENNIQSLKKIQELLKISENYYFLDRYYMQ